MTAFRGVNGRPLDQRQQENQPDDNKGVDETYPAIPMAHV